MWKKDFLMRIAAASITVFCAGILVYAYSQTREYQPRASAKPKPVFTVTARLLKPHEHLNQFAIHRDIRPYFEVRCVVTNISKTPQEIKTSSCSWNANWRISDARIANMGWICKANFPCTVNLAPGERYEKVLPLTAQHKAKGKTIAVRVGFTPNSLGHLVLQL